MNASSKQKRLAINVISNLVAFAINAGLAFFLSPYIVRTLGSEANGFITLANDFASYANILTFAVNSVAARFVALYYHQGDYKKANAFYTASFISNIITVLLLLLPCVLCIIKLDSILEMPAALVSDVKLLFCLVFLNFVLVNAFNAWNIATYVTNSVYLTSIRSLVSHLLKSGLVLVFFVFLQPSVYYVGLATLLATMYVVAYSFYYKRKLLPSIRVKKQDFAIRNVVTLFLAGIWNSINLAGNVLLNGLDLFIANLLIDSAAMGILSLAKTLPTAILTLATTLPTAFAPGLTKEYARGDIAQVHTSLKQAMRIGSAIVSIPVSILLVLGREFYTLWLPGQNAAVLYNISILACLHFIFVSGAPCLSNVFTTLNKLKVNSVVVLVSGVANSILVLFLVGFTDLGIYAIAGVSSSISIIRNLFYTVPYAAKYLNLPWYTFYPEVGLSVACCGAGCLITFALKMLFTANSWVGFLLCCFVAAILILACNAMLLLTKEQRKKLKDKISGKFK